MIQQIVKVIRPGLQTTVQDLGRPGYQQFGISPAGAMDPYSLQMANILVGNLPGEATLEASMIGPKLEAMCDVTIAICGGDLEPKVNGKHATMWKSFLLKKGEILSFGAVKRGCRAYISFAGGIDVPLVLGSKSTFVNGRLGGLNGRAIEAGDILNGHPAIRKNKFLHRDWIPDYTKPLIVRVILGPHCEKFTSAAIDAFLKNEYTISAQSNRMGCRLEGPGLEHSSGADIISDAIPLGGIQVPANGQPIILMAERQTTGGYARIGTVISADIPALAQAMPGTSVHFQEVKLDEAQSLHLRMRKCLKFLHMSSRSY